jgi:hypothetical protein
MQQRDNTQDVNYGWVLSNFVQVIRFDMSADFIDKKFDPDVAGTIFPGSPSVYATQDFMALIGEELNYYYSTVNINVVKSLILGFNISHHDHATTIFKPFCFGQIHGGETYDRGQSYPINRYAMDLYEGHLRVIITVGNRHKLSVLALPRPSDTDKEMLVVDERSLASTNRISADWMAFARFVGNYVYVEMVQGTTHVYNVSNSDLNMVGELEMTGYSEHTYLEPVKIDGVQCMLRLRQTGWDGSGFEISLIDVSDPTLLHSTTTYAEKDEVQQHLSTAVCEFIDPKHAFWYSCSDNH